VTPPERWTHQQSFQCCLQQVINGVMSLGATTAGLVNLSSRGCQSRGAASIRQKWTKSDSFWHLEPDVSPLKVAAISIYPPDFRIERCLIKDNLPPFGCCLFYQFTVHGRHRSGGLTGGAEYSPRTQLGEGLLPFGLGYAVKSDEHVR